MYDFVSVNMYLDLSCCAVIPGGGRNKEYALHLLQICKGNIKVRLKKRKETHCSI